MSTLICRRTIISVTILLASIVPRPAHAQDPRRLPFDFVIKKAHEWGLQRDQAHLQQDIDSGDAVSANRDLNRMQRDEWKLWYDRRRIRRDLLLPAGPWVHPPQAIPLDATLVPHPDYPGYGYYPSNPTQLYLLAQPAPSDPASDGSASGSTPGATTAPAHVAVVIVNAGPSGTAIDFVINSVAYKTESGQHQRLAVSPKSTILYDRGGDLGEQRYTLSAGVYEFRSGDAGWSLVKLQRATREDVSEALPDLVPKNELPAPTGAPSASKSGGNGS